jgi:hypothetical protein
MNFETIEKENLYFWSENKKGRPLSQLSPSLLSEPARFSRELSIKNNPIK